MNKSNTTHTDANAPAAAEPETSAEGLDAAAPCRRYCRPGPDERRRPGAGGRGVRGAWRQCLAGSGPIAPSRPGSGRRSRVAGACGVGELSQAGQSASGGREEVCPVAADAGFVARRGQPGAGHPIRGPGGGLRTACVEGVKMVAQLLAMVLERHHCRRIEAQGAVFDPHVHEAIAQLPSEQVPPGTVIEVAQNGYQLHDRVVRPAQVVVSGRPAAAAGGTAASGRIGGGDRSR